MSDGWVFVLCSALVFLVRLYFFGGSCVCVCFFLSFWYAVLSSVVPAPFDDGRAYFALFAVKLRRPRTHWSMSRIGLFDDDDDG